tara:strand:+ start:386 stop:523 length:138 start_codon:yes stop_codon:yes gene_type:complete
MKKLEKLIEEIGALVLLFGFGITVSSKPTPMPVVNWVAPAAAGVK